MSTVYRARNETNGRMVAIKTLEGSNARITRLFEREYHTLASLKHPNVIEVLDFGINAEGQRYYTMEPLGGADLQQLAPLPYRRACAHACDVATYLTLLHARRLLHPGVRPWARYARCGART
jgi:serine/threonine protein kinase